MGLYVLCAVVAIYGVYLLLHISQLYNEHVLQRFSRSISPDDLEFDYIIVGGGTAGSLLAMKMINENLLLLEAGSRFTLLPKLPILGPFWQGSPHDWQYVTEPQEDACKAMEGQRSNWPRGKFFGGSHWLSNLIHMESDAEDYHSYADPRQPFDYERDIGQYFKEYQDLIGSQEVPFESEFSRRLLLAGREIDFDFHRPNVSLQSGQRFTTASLYEQRLAETPETDRKHTLLFDAHVNRLIFTNDRLRVESVEFSRNGEVFVARASKAVIMSAGAIGTPAILLRSGVGPRADLESLGIESIVDLPMGKNLKDHVSTGLDLVSLNTSIGTGLLDAVTLESLLQFWGSSEGLIASPGCDLTGRTKVLDDSTTNDLQFMIIPVPINADHGIHFRKILNLRSDVYERYFLPQSESGGHSVTILAVALKPKSVGEIRLRSRDPMDPPIINPKYLSHPEDRRVLLEGIQLIKRLVESEELQKLGAKINPRIFPGCEMHSFDSDEYWVCYIEHLTMTTYHPSSTCRMGSCPKDSVVDYHFKVHGVENLYIVDASVMPDIPAANPISTIGMLALRFYDREIGNPL